MDMTFTSVGKVPPASSSANAQPDIAANISPELSSMSGSNRDEEASDDENGQPVNENCLAVTKCRSGVFDMRKVVSHIFGRNKSCTSQIAEECIVHYCRKHYQRYRYRTSKYKTWINTQIDCVRIQLGRMEEWGAVKSWTVALRLKARRVLNAEDMAAMASRTSAGPSSQSVAVKDRSETDEDFSMADEDLSGTEENTNAAKKGMGAVASADRSIQPCPERSLLPYIGTKKTFADVYAIVNFIEAQARASAAANSIDAEDNPSEAYQFPEIEFLPDIDRVKFPPAGERKRNEKKAQEIAASASALLDAATASDDDYDNDGLGDNMKIDHPTRHKKRSSMSAFELDDYVADDSQKPRGRSSAQSKKTGKVMDRTQNDDRSATPNKRRMTTPSSGYRVAKNSAAASKSRRS